MKFYDVSLKEKPTNEDEDDNVVSNIKMKPQVF